MANVVRTPRPLLRPYEPQPSTHAARSLARCASFVAHITWICRAFTGVQESLSTGDATRIRYGPSKRERAAVAAQSCGRRPSRRPRPRSHIQLTYAAPRARACAGIVVAGGSRCCSRLRPGACGRLRVLAALGDDGDLGQALGTAAGTAGARQAGGSGAFPVPSPALEERRGRGGLA